MGIKNLNTYFRNECTNYSISQKHLSFYRNKKFAIDTSIYLYRFLSENALIENMYLLISIFKNYNITPIFIFDGKPPLKKLELLKKRKIEKSDAETRYNELLKLENINKETKAEMELLYRKIVKIKEIHVKNIKKLMDDYGVLYFDSKGEADELCAYFAISGRVDYCLSDDTDMFLYNCPKVLRNISLINHCVLEYNTSNILKELNMSIEDFRNVLVLSGTDYNVNHFIDLKTVMSYFRKYQEYGTEIHFYDYLIQFETLEIDKDELKNIQKMYILNDTKYLEMDNLKSVNKIPDYAMLFEFLEKNGFIFYNRDDNKLPWKSSIPV